MPTPLAALTDMVRAVNAGDAARYASVYTDDAVITILGSGALHGRDAIEQHEVQLLRQFPGAELAIGDVWQQDHAVVARYAVCWRGGDGRAMGHEGLLFLQFDAAGRIAAERRYFDSLTPMVQLRALGARPARPLPELAPALRPHTTNGSEREQAANIATVRACLAAAAARDERQLTATVDATATFDEIADPEPQLHETTAAAWFAMWRRAVADPSCEVTAIHALGSHVLVETLARGTLIGRLGHVGPSPRPFTVHRAGVLQLRDGRIVAATWFMNGKELAESSGQWPLPPVP